MSTDNLFIAITNLIPNQDCDSQVLADIIRAEIDARIREAMKSKKPANDNYCPATGEAHNWRTLASGAVCCADCGKNP